MKELEIPNLGQKIRDGSVVMLRRFPGTKWIIHNGWYQYQGVKYTGWYFSSIPSRTILPCNDKDLRNIVVLSFDGSQVPANPNLPYDPYNDKFYPDKHEYITPQPYDPYSSNSEMDRDRKPKHPEHPPLGPVKCPEKYLGGVHYSEGQLIYAEYGDIYQATTNFRSSWSCASVSENLKQDIQSGYLVAIPDTISKTIDKEIKELTDNLDETNKNVDLIKPKKFAISFKEVFGDDIDENGKITKQMADEFLAFIGVEPSPGVCIKNTDKDSLSRGHVFTYYVNPDNPDKLILLDDTVDTHIKIDGKVDKDVAGENGRIVEDFKLSRRKDYIKVTKSMLSLEDGSVESTEVNYTLSDLGIADVSEVNNSLDEKVDKEVAGKGETIIKKSSIEDNDNDGVQLHRTELSLEDGSTKESTDKVSLSEMGAVSQEKFDQALSWVDYD